MKKPNEETEMRVWRELVAKEIKETRCYNRAICPWFIKEGDLALTRRDKCELGEKNILKERE